MKQFVILDPKTKIPHSKTDAANLIFNQVKPGRLELTWPKNPVWWPWAVSESVRDAIEKWRADSDDKSDFIISAVNLTSQDFKQFKLLGSGSLVLRAVSAAELAFYVEGDNYVWYELRCPREVKGLFISKTVYDAIKKWRADSNDNSDFSIGVSNLLDEDFNRE